MADREALFEEVDTLFKRALVLGRLMAEVGGHRPWPNEDLGYLITEEGVTVFDIEQDGDYGRSASTLIPWSVMDDPNAEEALRTASAIAKAEGEAARQRWKEEQYEKLRLELGKP